MPGKQLAQLHNVWEIPCLEEVEELVKSTFLMSPIETHAAGVE
jgi:hypothetical protein